MLIRATPAGDQSYAQSAHWTDTAAQLRGSRETDKSRLLFRFYRFPFCLSIVILSFPGSNMLQIIWEDKKKMYMNINVDGKYCLCFLQTWVGINNQRWGDILFHLKMGSTQKVFFSFPLLPLASHSAYKELRMYSAFTGMSSPKVLCFLEWICIRSYSQLSIFLIYNFAMS